MKRETKKRLTARDLKALGASPGLVMRRVLPKGAKRIRPDHRTVVRCDEEGAR